VDFSKNGPKAAIFLRAEMARKHGAKASASAEVVNYQLFEKCEMISLFPDHVSASLANDADCVHAGCENGSELLMKRSV
jgi:hypothetical protein